MSKVGVLTTGAGVDTIINLPYVPEFLLIGTTGTDFPIEGLAVTVAGVDQVNLQSEALITAYTKWMMESANGVIQRIIKISDGFIPGQNCQIKLTNAGATTPDIFAFSSNKGGDVLNVGTLTVQASTNEVFDNFMALIFDPANVDYANVTFEDGHNEKMTIEELKAYFVMHNQADTGALLGTLMVIDNMNVDDDGRGEIVQIDLWNGTGGNTTVAVVG